MFLFPPLLLLWHLNLQGQVSVCVSPYKPRELQRFNCKCSAGDLSARWGELYLTPTHFSGFVPHKFSLSTAVNHNSSKCSETSQVSFMINSCRTQHLWRLHWQFHRSVFFEIGCVCVPFYVCVCTFLRVCACMCVVNVYVCVQNMWV